MRKPIAAALVVFGALLTLAGPAAAQVTPDDDVVAPVLVIGAPTVTLIVSTLLPLLNGLALRPSNPAWVKALVANGIGIVAYSFTQVLADDGSAFLTEAWFHGLIASLVVMAASYFGVWRPIIDPNERVPTWAPLGDVLAPSTRP